MVREVSFSSPSSPTRSVFKSKSPDSSIQTKLHFYQASTIPPPSLHLAPKFSGDISNDFSAIKETPLSPTFLAPILILYEPFHSWRAELSCILLKFPSMSQIISTGSIHGSMLSPCSGSLQERVEKLKPASFESRLLPRRESRSDRIASRVVPVSARRIITHEPGAIALSEQEVPQVRPQLMFWAAF